MAEDMEFWMTRHSKSGKGVESAPGLSEAGVELAKERAVAIAKLVEESPEGAVVFVGGVTNAPRTRSTAETYVSEAERLLEERSEKVRFLKKEEIQTGAQEAGYLKTAENLAAGIQERPDEKVVIELPLFLKDFSMEKYLHVDGGEEVKPEWMNLLDTHGKDYTGAIKEWFTNPELRAAVDPKEVAEGCLKGMERLGDFVKRFLPDRPVKVAFVGHSFLIDAVLVYLTNDGQMTVEGFEKIGGSVVEETELSIIKFDEEGNPTVEYRGQEFGVNKEG